jgi:hypothetical protein
MTLQALLHTPAMQECCGLSSVVGVGDPAAALSVCRSIEVGDRNSRVVTAVLGPQRGYRRLRAAHGGAAGGIDRLPEGLERREALDAIAEVARALAALKRRIP